ncbi:DUF4145 domain-containing protein [uncultured Sphaerochaeta sp.]|uniref:DUF4145 domain-containing protein n=1 Tax=uncultured Sphaerochaeta sp. TaxID=886478 RepID=UPI002AA79EA3|nr:DUF4145 domain-containing protein [uncultured Sphaerochaeta sp.]
MDPFSWTCPFCYRTTTIVSSDYSYKTHFYPSYSTENTIALKTEFIHCPNPECGKHQIMAALYKTNHESGVGPVIDGEPLKYWNLQPSSSAIPQPEYIPEAIRQDYEEACSIINLSPKASATLARRCLQGMIRDYWGITKSRLVDEINALNGLVDKDTWSAIDAIRKIGNIGAHMEKDVNIIVDIEPFEAELLIQLIEDLFQTWYVTRYEREERLKKIQALAQSKKS